MHFFINDTKLKYMTLEGPLINWKFMHILYKISQFFQILKNGSMNWHRIYARPTDNYLFTLQNKQSEPVITIRNKWLHMYVPWHMWGLNKMLHLWFWIEFIYHKQQAWAHGLCITCIVATLYKATNFSCMTLLTWKSHLAKILESAVSNLDPAICNSYPHVSRISSDIRHHRCVLTLPLVKTKTSEAREVMGVVSSLGCRHSCIGVTLHLQFCQSRIIEYVRVHVSKGMSLLDLKHKFDYKRT